MEFWKWTLVVVSSGLFLDLGGREGGGFGGGHWAVFGAWVGVGVGIGVGVGVGVVDGVGVGVGVDVGVGVGVGVGLGAGVGVGAGAGVDAWVVVGVGVGVGVVWDATASSIVDVLFEFWVLGWVHNCRSRSLRPNAEMQDRAVRLTHFISL